MDSAEPLVRSPQQSHSRMVQQPSEKRQTLPFETSLTVRCRLVIVAHLERYPAEVFGVCDEEEWEAIVLLRHAKTQPKTGSGGLDGSGRMAPALSDKLLSEIEGANPHLAESETVDKLVWRDCVENRFRRNGMSRPKGLLLPWPLLAETVETCIPQLDGSIEEVSQAIQKLQEIPMNVSLLQQTGVGKSVKKSLKRLRVDTNFPSDRLNQLESILNSWKSLASDTAEATSDSTLLKDMEVAEKCLNWRQLFVVLKERHDYARSSQGKRMREARQKLASDRPKVVKVRPANSRQQKILAGSSKASSSLGSAASPVGKLSQLRQEALQSRQKLMPSTKRSAGASFGDAVASMSCTKKKKAAHPTKHVTLPGGRQMQVPGTSSKPFTKIRTLKK